MTKRWPVAAVGLIAVLAGSGQARAPQQVPAEVSAPAPRPVLDRYCVGCHNDRLKTGGVSLAGMEARSVADQPATWEKVIRKLRAGAMPPPGRPRPDAATTQATVSWLEHELDRLAAENPDPGRLPAFQRLTRTEYRNAIRDLFALEDLPKEMDLSLLLPADNSSSGFDNLRDLLFVSPTQLEQYLSAARKISRLAVGDLDMLPLVDTYRLPEESSQDAYVDGAPLGTRGGTVVSTYLPLDGTYVIHVQVADPPRERYELDVTVDGALAQRFTLAPLTPDDIRAALGSATRPETSAAATGTRRFERDREASFRRAAIAKGFEVSVPLKAGPRVVAATFVRHSGAIGEEEVRPSYRARGGLSAVSSVTIRGPQAVEGSGETPSRRRIFICRPSSPGDEQSCAAKILSALVRRAYRRPVTTADLDALMPFYERARADRGFEAGIQGAIERLLVSPQFLFRIEREPASVRSGSVYRVSDVELASRLSFFLWSSIPDDTLLDLAVRGTLRESGVLEGQVRRMLADPRSATLASNFAAQWLFLRDVEASRPNPVVFPEFNSSLRDAFERETALFVESIFREDRSVIDLLTADHTFLNERLATHYGIPHVYGSEFRRVSLGAGHPRRGLLGQGSILMLTSHATRTSPVLRGKYILDNLLATPPPPPPPDVPALREQSSDGKPLSMREAMAQHRTNPVCASCHAQMDPLGFALENFDGIGGWRARDETGEKVDVAGLLPDGTRLDGVDGLRRFLADRPTAFATGFAEKLLTYAVGRKTAYFDAPAVRRIVREAAANDFRLSAFVQGVVQSVPFQMRRAQAMSSPDTAVGH